MTPEPLSKLQPPDMTFSEQSQDAAQHDTAPSPSSDRPRLEWGIVDLNLQSEPHMEVFLPGLWKRMHDDDTFKMFFHEGPDMSFWQFVSALSNPAERVQLAIGYDKDGTAKEHAGLLILNHILFTDKVKRATGNFMFFHEYWNRHDTQDLASAVFQNWFGKLEADVIGGVTPRSNRAAIAFIKRIGFQVVGDIPMFTTYDGEPSASAISFMTKSMWRKRYQPDSSEPQPET